MAYGDYALQIFKFIPVGYWKINSASTEARLFGRISKSATKTSTLTTYRPLVFSSGSGAALLNSASSSISIPAISDYGIASSANTKQRFTIDFWYQNFSSDLSHTIMTVGNITVSMKNGRVELDFLGQKSYVNFEDFRDKMHITVMYDGNNSSLIVNNTDGLRTGFVNKANFTASPSISVVGKNGAVFQVSDIAVFSYNLSKQNIELLTTLGDFENREIEPISYYQNDTLFDKGIVPELETLKYEIGDSAKPRNCIITDGKITLQKKPLATINTGASFSATNGYQFTSAGSINFRPEQSDIDLSDTRISVTVKTFTSTSGTPLHIQFSDSSYIYFKIVSGSIKAYRFGDASEKSSIALSSPTVFHVDFYNGKVYLVYNSTSQEIGDGTYGVESIYIGNNISGTDPFSGFISDLTINYKKYPLQTGKYKLNLLSSYTDTIKPMQDGVVNTIAIVGSQIQNNFIDFKTNTSSLDIRYYPIMNGSSAGSNFENYYSCGGTLASNQIVSVTRGSSPLSSQPSLDTPALFAIRIFDTEAANDYSSFSNPSISDFRLYGYSSNVIQSDRGAIISSNTFNSIMPSETNRYDRAGYLCGFSPKTNSSISFTSTADGVLANTRSVYLNLKLSSIPSTGVIFTIGGATITLTNSTTFYRLKATGTATGLYVNNTYTAVNVDSQNMYTNIEYSLVLIIPSSTYSTASISNLSGASLSGLGFSSVDLSQTANSYFRSRISDFTFNQNYADITDSATINVQESAFSVRAFNTNIILS